MENDLVILAIETSCDETAAAVVKNGRKVLSNVISSQIALHTLYGGVVPEIASRKHIEKINRKIGGGIHAKEILEIQRSLGINEIKMAVVEDSFNLNRIELHAQ